jgi:hypothetical protein
MLRRMSTHLAVESRRYYFEDWEEGIAQLVRAERQDTTAWTRVLEAIFWWPAREGKEWPARVVPIPEWTGVGDEADAWAHFEAMLETDQRYRWEPLPPGAVGDVP